MATKFFTFLRFPYSSSWPFLLASLYLFLFFFISLFVKLLPIHYLPNQLDTDHVFQAPFTYSTHWLGTDQLGRDVLSNVAYGCQTALLVSFPGMILAISIGMVLGSLAGYFGDRGVRIRLASLLSGLLASSLAYYYAFYLRQFPLAHAWKESARQGIWQFLVSLLLAILIFAVVFLLRYSLGKGCRVTWLSQSTYLPMDTLVLKLVELLSSVPNLVIILFFASLTKPSILLLVVITGLTYWTEPARLIRAEMLRIKQLTYVESARALGLSEWQILRRHALPNAMPAILVAFAFGSGHLMALESTLSFLGVGVPPDTPSWGRIVMGLQEDFSAWWLVVFPGLTLCFTVLSLQTCTNYYLRRRR